MGTSTQLVDLDLNEISGVDHPANLHEGWLVLKNSDDSLDRALGEAAVAITDEPDKGDNNVELTHETPTEAVVEKEVNVIDADFRKQVTDLQKALDEARAEADAVKTERALEKAVTRAADWANVPQVDADEFGPVLRTLREAAPEETDKIEAILDAVQTALTETDALTKEIGTDTTADTDDPYERITALGKSLVDSGEATSLADGIGKAAAANPDVYAAYIEQLGG